MLRQFRHITAPALLATLIVWLAGVATSCREMSDMPYTPPTGDDDVVQAVFTISMGAGDLSMLASRATPTDGEYDPGSGLENYIDVPNGDYRCYLFDKDNVLVCPLTVVRMVQVGGEGSRTYSVLTNLDDTDEVKNAIANGCKFVFLANWCAYPQVTPGVTTIDDLCTSAAAVTTFDQSRTTLSMQNLIPMYGVKDFNDGIEGLKKANIYDIGTLRLLRAYAKVEVTTVFVTATSQVETLSVKLTNTNDRAYKAPAGVYAEADYVHGTWSEDYTPVNIPADAQKIAGVTLTRSADDDMKFEAYVPEFQNVSPAGNPLDEDLRARLKIDFSIDGYKYSGNVDFSTVDKDNKETHFDIERNNWYKFTVRITAPDIDWDVVVVPYAETVLNPDFGLLPPVPDEDASNFEPVINTADSTVIYYRNPKTNACLAPDQATEIADPENTLDAATGYQIVQTRFPGRGNVVYFYYDPVRKVQLAPDRKTYVRTVFSINEPGYVIYIELEDHGDGTYIPTGKAFYFQSYTDVWYDDIPTREDNPPTITNPYPAP